MSVHFETSSIASVYLGGPIILRGFSNHKLAEKKSISAIGENRTLLECSVTAVSHCHEVDLPTVYCNVNSISLYVYYEHQYH